MALLSLPIPISILNTVLALPQLERSASFISQIDGLSLTLRTRLLHLFAVVCRWSGIKAQPDGIVLHITHG
jgi:hypothetical protein